MMAEQPKARGAAVEGVGKRGSNADPRYDEPPTLANAGRPSEKIGSELDPISPPTLSDSGIDKHLADRASKYAAIPELISMSSVAGKVLLLFCFFLSALFVPRTSYRS